MGRLALHMSMSLDGYIAGPGDKDNPLDTKEHRLLDEHRAPTGRPTGNVSLVTDGIESCAGQAKVRYA